MRIELIYDDDCPNASGARELLGSVLAELGRPVRWLESCRQDANAPGYVQQFGSPTILVNNHDVVPLPDSSAAACRVYRSADGRLSGVPPRAALVAAIRADNRPMAAVPGEKSTVVAAFFASALAALPVVGCAGCWPAYAALLATLGIGFVNYTPFVLPGMALLSAVGLFGLFYRARTRRGLAPFWLGVAATAVLFAGCLVPDFHLSLVVAGVLFMGAALWNAWPLSLRGSQAQGPDCVC